VVTLAAGYPPQAVATFALPRRLRAVGAALVLAILVGLPGAASVAVAQANPPHVDAKLADKLQSHLDRWRVNHRAPGVAAAVRLPDGSRWIGTSGVAVRGKGGRPVRRHTPFAVASLTKTFMAALVLRLREEGKLFLGAPLSRWLPDYPRARRITVEMLLNHRSGVFDYFAHPRYERLVFGRPRHRWTARQILALRGQPYCDPGKCYHYSNTNYVLLGVIVRKVTGKAPAAGIRRRFLRPLGLDESTMQGQEPIRRIAAKGYWATSGRYIGFSDGSRFRPNTSAATIASSAGAMLASVRDISDWQDALLSGDVLEPASLARMLDFDRRSGYGLGMRRARLAGRPAIGHGGSLRGFVSIMYRLPDEDIDVTILTNLGRSNPQGLADHLTRATLRHAEDASTP
jgi:D-alanyl-D-alanine carboxypeptidase